MGSFTDFISPHTGQYHAASQSDYRVTERRSQERQALAAAIAAQKAQTQQLLRGPSALEEEDIRSQIARRAAQSENERFGSIVDALASRNKRGAPTPEGLLSSLFDPELAKKLKGHDLPFTDILSLKNARIREKELAKDVGNVEQKERETIRKAIAAERKQALLEQVEGRKRGQAVVDALYKNIGTIIEEEGREGLPKIKELYDNATQQLSEALTRQTQVSPDEFRQELEDSDGDYHIAIQRLQEKGRDTSAIELDLFGE